MSERYDKEERLRRETEVDGTSASCHGADVETSYGFAKWDAGERDSGLQDTDELRV